MSLPIPHPTILDFRPQWAECLLPEGVLDRPRIMVSSQNGLNLYAKPDHTSALDSQLLLGEELWVFAEKNGWSWVQSQCDYYQGYCLSNALKKKNEKTHWVNVPSTFKYAAADLKASKIGDLSMCGQVVVRKVIATKNGDYAQLADGSAVFAGHLTSNQVKQPNWVKQAEAFIGRPYLWAGRTGVGLDCSALLQLSLLSAGIWCPRDTDMQSALMGDELDLKTPLEELKRGDLVFWKGHVGIVTGPMRLLHANARTMDVANEDLTQVVDRIAERYGKPTAFRRLAEGAGGSEENLL